MPDYISIFSENINWIREYMGITRQELAGMGGVSTALMTDISRGTANPTLKVMETLANNLGIPLFVLLKPSISDEWQALISLTRMPHNETPADTPHIPAGYELIENVVLPQAKADVVKEWLAAPRRGRPRTRKES